VSSRAEEKAQRRKERMEAEAAAARGAGRARRLQIVGGTILAVALIAGLVAVVAGGGSGGSSGKGPNSDAAPSSAKIPAQKVADFNAAVKAAGCVYTHYPNLTRTHTTQKVDYKMNPPVGGPHNPDPAPDGKYDAGNEPGVEHWVHTLEHGRVITMYKPGTPKATVDQLSALFDESLNGTPGYHELLLENNSHMTEQVAMVAWGQQLTCKTMNPQVFDAFRAFRKRFVDKAPEFFP
jgi:hypothetical protein